VIFVTFVIGNSLYSDKVKLILNSINFTL